ncbi:hypothetical protein GW17_00022436 [Ensete ventricosum]|nr:hypothetical protein GW17_00022436 [Ensete ventricosum]
MALNVDRCCPPDRLRNTHYYRPHDLKCCHEPCAATAWGSTQTIAAHFSLHLSCGAECSNAAACATVAYGKVGDHSWSSPSTMPSLTPNCRHQPADQSPACFPTLEHINSNEGTLHHTQAANRTEQPRTSDHTQATTAMSQRLTRAQNPPRPQPRASDRAQAAPTS